MGVLRQGCFFPRVDSYFDFVVILVITRLNCVVFAVETNTLGPGVDIGLCQGDGFVFAAESMIQNKKKNKENIKEKTQKKTQRKEKKKVRNKKEKTKKTEPARKKEYKRQKMLAEQEQTGGSGGVKGAGDGEEDDTEVQGLDEDQAKLLGFTGFGGGKN